MVEGMAGLLCHHMPQYGHTEKRKISNAVKDLMPDKLILIAEAVIVDDIEPVDNNGVIQRSALGKSITFEIFDFLQKAKGSGADRFLFENYPR